MTSAPGVNFAIAINSSVANAVTPASRNSFTTTRTESEARADALGDRAAAIRLSGDFHRALAQMAGNPVFVRVLEGLLPTTSLLMALYSFNNTPYSSLGGVMTDD